MTTADYSNMSADELKMNEPDTIVIATELTDDARAILAEADGVQIIEVTPKREAVREHLANAQALITRDNLLIDDELLAQGPHLRLIARVSPGISNIDIDAATKRGILVMNTPGASAIAAGEHTIALMLALSRKLVTAHNSLREGYWLLDRKRQAGTQLYKKTLGLIGFGRVGNVVAQRSLAFGMTVLAYDPYISEDTIDDRVQLIGLKELLQRSDVVSLHVPHTRETREIINADTIAQMKDGARLINTANGRLVNEDVLAEALKSGKLAGMAVDVYAEEPPYNSPLIGLDTVLHTPRIGDNTIEATQDLSMKVVAQVLDALHDHDYRNTVNMPLLPGVDYETVRPYINLAERMGGIFHILSRNPVRRVAVEVRGEDLTGLIKSVTVGVLKGLLQPILGDAVSTINAPLLAHERGWQVTQAKGLMAGEYSNAVTVQVTLEDGEEIAMTGTLLDRSSPYIVQINEYRMNFVPRGHLLLMGSQDKPGVIGRVGTLLSENGVNIAGWYTGRAAPSGPTLTVLTLDDAISDELLSQLLELDFVRHAHQLSL